MALRVCAEPSCPELVSSGRCTDHTREQDRARGSRQQRGYGRAHDMLRARWKAKVERGDTRCARCAMPIMIGQEWALDHNDDRTGYLGPSHTVCNNAAGGRAVHRR